MIHQYWVKVTYKVRLVSTTELTFEEICGSAKDVLAVPDRNNHLCDKIEIVKEAHDGD